MDPLHTNTTPLFFRYAIPTVLGMLAMSSTGVVDAMFVGNYVGSDALAAVNITLPVWSAIIGITLMLSVGGSVMCGKLIGANKQDEAVSLFNKILASIVVIIAIFTAIGLFWLEELLHVLGANAELIVPSANYLRIILWFSPVVMIGIGLYYFIRLDGHPSLASFALLAASIVNALLDYLFIAHLNLELQGAALATGLSLFIIIPILLPYFLLNKGQLKFAKPTGSWRTVQQAAFNGFSEFANEISVGITTLLFNWIMIIRLGVDGVAAFAIVNAILWIGLMVSFAIADSLQPLVSKNFGARKSQRIKRLLGTALLTAFVFGLIMIAVLLTVPALLIDLFIENAGPETFAIATQFIAWIWPVFLFNGINIAFSSYLTAMHKPIESTIVALSRSLVLPALCLLVLPPILSHIGVFLALPIAELVSFIIAIKLYSLHQPQRVCQQG